MSNMHMQEYIDQIRQAYHAQHVFWFVDGYDRTIAMEYPGFTEKLEQRLIDVVESLKIDQQILGSNANNQTPDMRTQVYGTLVEDSNDTFYVLYQDRIRIPS